MSFPDPDDLKLLQLQQDTRILRAHVALLRMAEALKYSESQPRAPAGTSIGGRWIAAGRLLRFAGPMGAATAAGLALYEILSRRNRPDSRAVAEFRARVFDSYKEDDKLKLDLTSVRTLTRDESQQFCPRLEEVQAEMDTIAKNLRKERPDLKQPYLGTELHSQMKRWVDRQRDPNFVAEISFLKGDKDTYGVPGTVRIEILNWAGNGTTCIYDPKSGSRRMSWDRITELAAAAVDHFPQTRRIVVMEVRESQ